jgi:hypothetical protein
MSVAVGFEAEPVHPIQANGAHGYGTRVFAMDSAAFEATFGGVCTLTVHIVLLHLSKVACEEDALATVLVAAACYGGVGGCV